MSSSFPSISTFDSLLTPSSSVDLTGPHLPKIERVPADDQGAPPPRQGPPLALVVVMVLMLLAAIGLALILVLR